MDSNHSHSHLPLNKIFILIMITVFFLTLYTLTCFPVINKNVCSLKEKIIIADNRVISTGDRSSFPASDGCSSDISSYNNLTVIRLAFKDPVTPEVGDYIKINMVAENTKGVPYPQGSFAVDLGTENITGEETAENTQETKPISNIQERTKFFIDGFNHEYYTPIGENKYYRFGWQLGILKPREQLNSIVLEIPAISGIKIDITGIELKKRSFFPLDSYLNYFIKDYFRISYINRYLTPAYLFLLLSLLIFLVYRLMLFTESKRQSKPGSNAASYANNNKRCSASFCNRSFTFFYPKETIQNSNKTSKIIIAAVFLSIACFSVFYFLAAGTFFTVKSYMDSYSRNIFLKDEDNAYYGFYDFEKFILWLNSNIPVNENIIVPLKGEPVYIMAEMAYNLYPRDIKFPNTSGKELSEVINDIESISMKGKTPAYNYIVVLWDAEPLYYKSFEFVAKYRENGGFIFRVKD